ncbi:hypothetical protein LCGC14_1788030 [marine sediment metagenome]|uniref:Uncharacterized protein n=1 Tax=marine sediment metagenome TaxID=412755 RepID=A0A0F9J895_9ZZZZ
MAEQMYRFIDKTGHCFEDFQTRSDDEWERKYNDMVGAMLRASNDGKHDFTVGDMMCFKDELEDAGYKWGVDFFCKKV